MTFKRNLLRQNPICKLVKITRKEQTRRRRNIKMMLLLLIASLAMLSSCAGQGVVSRSSANPDLLTDCSTDDLFDLMKSELDGAQGLNENWLLRYAATAQDCKNKLNALQSFVAN